MKTRDILAKPRYIPQPREKTLALVDDENRVIITETGSAYSYNGTNFVSVASEHNLLLFISSLAGFSQLGQFVKHGKVIISKEQAPIYASRRGRHDKKQTSVVIVEAGVWGYAYTSRAMLNDLRALFDHCFVGVYATPGALAYAIYAHVQYEKYGHKWRWHRHIRPAAAASEFLEEHKRGARIEVFTPPDIEYLEVDELDMSNAYLYMYRVQPAGRAYHFMYGDFEDFVWFEAHCKLTIYEQFPYGLIGSKKINGAAFEEMVFIKEPGDYQVVLGKHEIDLLQQAGCDVEILSGYGWYELTDDPALYSERMTLLRNTAPNKAVKQLVKKVGVAGIGRDGMSQDMCVLVSAEKRADGDIPLVSDKTGRVYNYFIHNEIDTAPKSMTHWYSNTTELLRVFMTRLMFKFGDGVLAINTDGIYVLPNELSKSYPEKELISVSGEITRETHYGVSFPETGHIDAKSGKHRHPGKPQYKRKRRQTWLDTNSQEKTG